MSKARFFGNVFSPGIYHPTAYGGIFCPKRDKTPVEFVQPVLAVFFHNHQDFSGRTHAGATLKLDHRIVLESGREFDDTDVLAFQVHFSDRDDMLLMIEDLARFGEDWHSSELDIVSGEPFRLVIMNHSRANVYIDNVSLDSGPGVKPFVRPDSKRPPEDFNEPPLIEVLERRLIDIEKQVDRLTKELAKQQSPDLSKEADKQMGEQTERTRTSNEARDK